MRRRRRTRRFPPPLARPSRTYPRSSNPTLPPWPPSSAKSSTTEEGQEERAPALSSGRATRAAPPYGHRPTHQHASTQKWVWFRGFSRVCVSRGFLIDPLLACLVWFESLLLMQYDPPPRAAPPPSQKSSARSTYTHITNRSQAPPALRHPLAPPGPYVLGVPQAAHSGRCAPAAALCICAHARLHKSACDSASKPRRPAPRVSPLQEVCPSGFMAASSLAASSAVLSPLLTSAVELAGRSR